MTEHAATDLDRLLDAVRELDVRPREQRWTSLTYCLLDAVWSIGISYDKHVVPAVRRVAEAAGDPDPVVKAGERLPTDPLPLSTFRSTYPDPAALREVTSAHRTSSRNGILKAEAALRYADTLLAADIDTLEHAQEALADVDRVERLSAGLRSIPGDGVRTDYFWMLVGDDDKVKPDRMILRFLRRNGLDTDVAGAKAALVAVAARLGEDSPAVTPWMVDHAIWDAERRQSR